MSLTCVSTIDTINSINVCQPGGISNQLFLHRADGTLADISSESGTDLLNDSPTALFVDLDNDGNQDLVVATLLYMAVLRGDGRGHFSLASEIRVDNAVSISSADYDNDGRLDLYVCRYSNSSRSSVSGASIYDSDDGTAAQGDGIIAVTGSYGVGTSVLYVIDTKSKQLAVYEARGGSGNGRRIYLVGARRIDLDLQLEGVVGTGHRDREAAADAAVLRVRPRIEERGRAMGVDVDRGEVAGRPGREAIDDAVTDAQHAAAEQVDVFSAMRALHFFSLSLRRIEDRRVAKDAVDSDFGWLRHQHMDVWKHIR